MSQEGTTVRPKWALLWIVKLTVTIGVLIWLAGRIERETIEILRTIHPLALIAGMLLLTGAVLTSSIRWWLIFRHTRKFTNFREILPSYYLGVFFNNILPSSTGGDVARILHLKIRGFDVKALLASTLVDRAIGSLTMVAVASLGILFVPQIKLQQHDQLILILFVVTVFVFALLFFSSRTVSFMQHLASKYQRTRIRAFFIEAVHTCQSYRDARTELLGAIVLTLLAQTLLILTYYVLSNGLGIGLSLPLYFVIVPLVFLAASLPISVGGLGVREGALVVLFTTFGSDEHAAIALSLTYLVSLWIVSLPGAVIFLMERSAKQVAKE